MAVKNYLARGNGKLDKTILGWSITPVLSCLNCSQCKDKCYAIGPYNRYPCVKNAWDRNYNLAKSGQFMEPVVGQITRSRLVSAVRIHVAGDFFNQTYLDNWTDIIKKLPSVPFYGYTKVMHLLNFEKLLALPNINMINSIAPDDKPNFGDADRVKKLQSMGYRVCPATIKGNNITCGINCKLCQTNDKVCFHQH